MKNILLISLVFFFFACEKAELPVKSYDRGTTITSTVSMDPNYINQVYFKLHTNTIVSTNNKFTWDLAFSCDPQLHRILLNSSKAMYVWPINNRTFETIKDTIGFENNKRWDASSGALDSTGFGNLIDTSTVYLIFLGYSEMGTSLGFKKMKIISLLSEGYQILYADLNGANRNTLTITKDQAYNVINFSFKNNTIAQSEPRRYEYDLLFTQYTYTFQNPYQPYLVTGVLINPTNVLVGKLTERNFAEVSIADTSFALLSNKWDAIGYDWKEFNFNTNKFTVEPNTIFIIKDQNNFFYKLHFIDFYNENGQKGNPKFEFQKL